MANYLHRLLQLKYPVHVNAITLSRIEELLHNHCAIAENYQEELKKWTIVEHYDKNVKKVQLPYTQPIVNPGLSVEQRGERRKELARRLTEMNAKRREERLSEDQTKLAKLTELLGYLNDGYTIDMIEGFDDLDVKTTDDVEKAIIVLQSRIDRTQQKIAVTSSGSFSLTPTTNTDDRDSPKPPLPPPGVDVGEWLDITKKKRQTIMDRRNARKQRRSDMARRRTAAAQERMRIISQLARKEKGNDDFGMRDEDWDVYKTISKEGGDSDSEVENEKLIELEEILRHYDPTYDDTLSISRSAAGQLQNFETIGEAHQLHVGIEAIRSPELLFQPSMSGSFEAGLAETIEYVLKQFDANDQIKLASNVFLTGGCAHLPGLKDRLSRELLEMRPFQSYHKVTVATNPSIGAWNGALELARSSDVPYVTKADYDEFGGEYLKLHYASNVYFKSPGPITVDDL